MTPPRRFKPAAATGGHPRGDKVPLPRRRYLVAAGRRRDAGMTVILFYSLFAVHGQTRVHVLGPGPRAGAPYPRVVQNPKRGLPCTRVHVVSNYEKNHEFYTSFAKFPQWMKDKLRPKPEE